MSDGFVFTGDGFKRLKQGEDGTIVASGDVVPLAVPAPTTAQPQPQPQPPASSRKKRPFGPGDVIKAAKQRLREINAELKRMKKLEKERDQLRRLLKAAEEKPSNVRSIRSAS